jgi:uncharacterized protein (DUF362 family)
MLERCPNSQNLKRRFSLKHHWFYAAGFLSFLWLLVRSGMNPKRLTYPCQQAAISATANWFLAILAFFSGSVLLKRVTKLSGIVIIIIGGFWFFNALPESGLSEDNFVSAINMDGFATNNINTEYICGDVNNDATVNIKDITFLIKYKYKDGDAPLYINSGDVNSDGSINIKDITYLIKYKYKEGPVPDCIESTLSRVVIVEDVNATDGWTINSGTVQIMMDSAVMGLTQITDIGEAWKSLFPDITLSSVIAIKVNCINHYLSSHPQVANTIVEGLKQMMFDGNPFPENNIIIYDRTDGELVNAGYTINTSATGVRCFGSNHTGVGYSTEYYDVSGSSQRISRIITEMADYIVNLSVMKNHTMSGATFCMKNHYGTCHDPGVMHGNNCSPFIPALNALPQIADKQVINICDALYGIYFNGPMGFPQFVANKIFMSKDIVAADYCAMQILADEGCTTLGMAHYIATAATAYGLGTNNPAEMDIVDIVNPSSAQPVGD